MPAFDAKSFDPLAAQMRNGLKNCAGLIVGGVKGMAHISTIRKIVREVGNLGGTVSITPDGLMDIGSRLSAQRLAPQIAHLSRRLLYRHNGEREFCWLAPRWEDTANEDNISYERRLGRLLGLPSFVAHCVCYYVKDGDIKIVLGKRADSGQWESPIAGGIRVGETPEATLAHEGKRECGLDLPALAEATGEAPVYLGTMHTLNQHPERPNKIIQGHIRGYALKVPEGTAFTATDEFTEFEHVSLREFLERMNGKKAADEMTLKGENGPRRFQFKYDAPAAILLFAHHLKRLEPVAGRGVPFAALQAFVTKMSAPAEMKPTVRLNAVPPAPRSREEQPPADQLG